MIMKRIILPFIFLSILSCKQKAEHLHHEYFEVTGLQKIEVIVPTENSIHGTMFLYERSDTGSHWKLFDSFNVNIGKNGLARDSQNHTINTGANRIKHEGDGCSPGGIFTLGKVFSYHPLSDLKMPFKQVDENDLCVDDTTSEYYNTFIDQDTIADKDYNSFEHMHRNDLQYEYGVWVNYNAAPVIPGNGSCIFLHIWKDENAGTSGCTSMSKENMLKLIHWLDAEKDPVLIQYADSGLNK